MIAVVRVFQHHTILNPKISQTIAIAISTDVYNRLTGVGNVGGIIGDPFLRCLLALAKGVLQVPLLVDLSSLL